MFDRSRQKITRKGFTLIELSIVVLILGIMAASAAPRIGDSIVSFRLNAAAKRVASDLDLARRNAMVTSATRTVNFDVATNSYSLPGITDLDRTGQAYVVDLSDTGYAATLASADFSGSASVSFDMYGKPSDGGTVVIQVGSKQQTVTVDVDDGKTGLSAILDIIL